MKYIKLSITILIPLLAAFLIGIYGYDRYQDIYFAEYMDDTAETVVKKEAAYVKYLSTYYEKEPYFKTDIRLNNDASNEKIGTFAVYRYIIEVNETVDDEIVKTPVLYYAYTVYDINYTALGLVIDPDGDYSLKTLDLPDITLRIHDDTKDDTYKDYTFGTIEISAVNDYNVTPKKDSDGTKLENTLVKWTSQSHSDIEKIVTFELIVKYDYAKESKTIVEYGMDDFEIDPEKIEYKTDFEKGYNGNFKKAGYASWVIKDFLWWECLIAFVLVGIITGSFYVVWNANEEDIKQAQKLGRQKNKKTK